MECFRASRRTASDVESEWQSKLQGLNADTDGRDEYLEMYRTGFVIQAVYELLGFSAKSCDDCGESESSIILLHRAGA